MIDVRENDKNMFMKPILGIVSERVGQFGAVSERFASVWLNRTLAILLHLEIENHIDSHAT